MRAARIPRSCSDAVRHSVGEREPCPGKVGNHRLRVRHLSPHDCPDGGSRAGVAVVAVHDEVFTPQEQIALGGFLAGCSGRSPHDRDEGVLIIRKLIAWVLMYSLDGLLADEDTEYWQFCFGLTAGAARTAAVRST